MGLEPTGYRNCKLCPPKRYDDYLVKTKQGCYYLAHYNCNGWHCDGDPEWWMEIPKVE